MSDRYLFGGPSMPADSSVSGGHLDYYIEHAISPVHYDTSDFQAHIDRRDALYRSIGLPPVAFKGAHVLEVAPGSGQNSLYPATCLPASLTLVEPNPHGRKDIVASYEGLERAHTAPVLVPQTLQEFEPKRPFDVVICENWLGSLPSEVALIQKLASMVAPGGVMVLTIVPAAGFFPNVMRKLLAMRLVNADDDFERKTAILIDVFGPHLATMASMGRSHRDWVHDCMINPHYLNVGLPLRTVLEAVGSELEALSTFPRFANDWRWFKALTGTNRQFSERLLAAESANVATFIDYRRTFPETEPGDVAALQAHFAHIHALSLKWQVAFEADDFERIELHSNAISDHLVEIQAGLSQIDPELGAAVAELRDVWDRPVLGPDDVRQMPKFGALFGRETVYLSLTRPLGSHAIAAGAPDSGA